MTEELLWKYIGKIDEEYALNNPKKYWKIYKKLEYMNPKHYRESRLQEIFHMIYERLNEDVRNRFYEDFCKEFGKEFDEVDLKIFIELFQRKFHPEESDENED